MSLIRKVCILFGILVLASSSSVAWLNSTFEYRSEYGIKENSGSDLSEYQIKVSVDTQSLISSGRMQPDCSDIRWGNSKDVSLDYWLRGECNTSSTEIFVEVKKLSADSNKTIYMYHGNPESESKSDPEATMYIYDLHGNGFDGNLRGTANFQPGDNKVELTDTINGQQGSLRYPKGTPNPGFYARWDWYTGGGSGADSNNLVAFSNGNRFELEDPNRNGIHWILNDHDDCNGVTFDSQCGDIDSWSENPAKSAWRHAEAYGVVDGNNLRYMFDTITGDLQGTSTNSAYPPGDEFGFSGRIGGLNNHHWVRNITVRKFTLPKPTVSLLEKSSRAGLCDSIGKDGECIVSSAIDFQSLITPVTTDRKLVLTGDISILGSKSAFIDVSNNTILDGNIEGSISLDSRRTIIRPGASLRPGTGGISVLNQ